ncbi:MAG: DUF3575 domain-containing protein [Saprospiraceae bacterium]|nr:DUF3575 domain-containing protein [Saprospiraceae bacterium]MCB9343915.1 DUF3575 domain-containing protein [Lewinellaceae bacterium]
MKRLFLLAALAVISFGTVRAQVDVKVGPIGLLFSSLNFGVEFGVKPNFGVELTPGIAWNTLALAAADEDYKGLAYRLGVNGRYYLNPSDKGLNGFYIGAYTRYGGGNYSYTYNDGSKDEYNSTRFSGGFLLGGKIVSRNEKIVFDLGMGFGRAFVYKFTDPNGNNEADLSDIPFVNWDIPINLKIGFRFGGNKG